MFVSFSDTHLFCLWIIHIVTDFCLVVAPHRRHSIKQHGKEIFLDISDLCCVVLHTLNDIFHMAVFQLQESGSDKFRRITVSCDFNLTPLRQHNLQNQVADPVDDVLLVGKSLQKAAILNILLDELCVSCHIRSLLSVFSG
jgi:hypothetical protein